MISFQNISKSFGKLQVLQSVSLDIDAPGIYAILGPNGSGKTTLIKSFMGMVHPDAGDIIWQGKSVLKQWQYRDNISYLPQIANFPKNVSVGELIQFIKNLRQKPSDETPFISQFQLASFLNKKLGYLSGGTKQKVNLLLAFMTDNPVVVLDEPTSGLDPAAMQVLKQILKAEKEKGKTILMTSHVMDFVEEISDEVVYLLEGKIHFRGSVDVLKNQTQSQTIEMAIAKLIIQEHA
ncbi:MAG: ABC transporter ATP-binding protein [Flavobacteriaceae bacterium]|nr:ABC transporter ATP-binding protein [Flavobacteriaceae bacterium]